MPSDRRRFNGRPDQVMLARQFVVSALVEDSPIREVVLLLGTKAAQGDRDGQPVQALRLQPPGVWAPSRSAC